MLMKAITRATLVLPARQHDCHISCRLPAHSGERRAHEHARSTAPALFAGNAHSFYVAPRTRI
eukprot:9767311-Alexandrium_andersonii.AAC.1